MFDTPAQALRGVELLAAFSLLTQSLELWLLRRTVADTGVWRLALLRADFAPFPRPLRALLDGLLGYRGFRVLLLMRGLGAVALIVHPHWLVPALLLASSVLIAMRWRGSFNGGSDFMTLVVLTALSLAAGFESRPIVALGCLWYIVIQTCNSYFLAGVVKLRTASWRSGEALPDFLTHAIYENGRVMRWLPRRALHTRLASWAVIGLECTFPLALIDRRLCLGYIAMALTFHIINVYVFGLNRFVWAWAATYPALWYCSGRLLG